MGRDAQSAVREGGERVVGRGGRACYSLGRPDLAGLEVQSPPRRGALNSKNVKKLGGVSCNFFLTPNARTQGASTLVLGLGQVWAPGAGKVGVHQWT